MNTHYQGLGHLAIATANMAESLAFYARIGGAVLAQESLPGAQGDKLLALVDLGGVTLELIETPGEPLPGPGNLPHFALYVDDVDATAAALRAAGVDTFETTEKTVLPTLFGGLENWFFTGPSGERIELLNML